MVIFHSFLLNYQRVIPLVEQLKRGVVSNLSCPPGLLMSDVHAAESCAGAAVVLQSSNEVGDGWKISGPRFLNQYKSIYIFKIEINRRWENWDKDR